jgi:hypothetical protein
MASLTAGRPDIVDHMTSYGGLCGPLSDQRRVPGVAGWSEALRSDSKNHRSGFLPEARFDDALQVTQKDRIGERSSISQIPEIEKISIATNLVKVWMELSFALVELKTEASRYEVRKIV